MDPQDRLPSRTESIVAALLPKVDSTVAGRASAKIDLATAENWLIRSELVDLYKEAIHDGLTADTLSYPQGFGGHPALLEALSGFFNKQFGPIVPVFPEHIVATPGATSCLDALLTSICEDGDGVLVPAPYWSGFDLHFSLRPHVTIISVGLTEDDVRELVSINPSHLSCGLVTALTKAYDEAPDPRRVRALVLTNPHNPFGICYPAGVLQACMDFCRERSLHYVSDEVYALSLVPSAGPATEARFTSALSLTTGDRKSAVSVPLAITEYPSPPSETRVPDNIKDRKRGRSQDHPVQELSGSPDKKRRVSRRTRVHVIWSISKDFGSSGPRMAALISQSPSSRAIRASVSLLSSLHLSTITSLVTTHLLSSPRLDDLISLNSARLAIHHDIACAAFRRWGLPFIRAEAGLFVFVCLSPCAKTRAEEEAAVKKINAAGVIVTAGSGFGGWGSWGSEQDVAGWVRITVAVPGAVLREGLDRIGEALGLREMSGAMLYNSSIVDPEIEVLLPARDEAKREPT